MADFLTALVTRRSGALAVLMGVALLLLAVPYALASFLLVTQPEAVQPKIIAHSLFADSRTARDLARAQLSQARRGEKSWDYAYSSMQQAVAERPLDGLVWARLGYILTQDDFIAPPPGPQAPVRMLLQSMAYARFAPEYMDWRFMLAARYWSDMLAAQQNVVADQAGLMWHKKTRSFIRLARIPALAAALETMMSRYYPEEQAKFLHARGPLRHNSVQQESSDDRGSP